jgi:hypothetical protein
MGKSDYKVFIIILFQFLVFAVLNGFGLLGTDDIYTMHSTSGNYINSLHKAIHFEMQAPLYFLLMSFWRGISDSLVWAKIFHYLSFLLSSIFFYKILRILLPNRKDIYILLLFFALHPFLFYISNDLRRYSLTLLFAVITLYYFIRIYLKGHKNWKNHLFLIIFSTAGIFNDYYHTFLLASLGVGVLFSNFKHRWHYYLDMIIPFAGFLFLLRIIQYQSGSSGDWPISYIESGVLFSSFKHLLFLIESQTCTFLNLGMAGNMILRITVFGGFLYLIRKEPLKYHELFISAAFMVIILLGVITYLKSTSLLKLEYTAFLYPLVFLCFSLVLTSVFRNSLVKSLVIIAFLALFFLGYQEIYSGRHELHRNLKTISEKIDNSLSDQVVFVFNPKDAEVINFYLSDSGKSVISVPGPLDLEVYSYSARMVGSEEQVGSVLSKGLGENSEFFIILREQHLSSNTYNSQLLFLFLDKNFICLSKEHFGPFLILKYSAKLSGKVDNTEERASEMRMIEFVGCEGIGKTSLYKELMRSNAHSRKHILSEYEADHLIARNFLERNYSNIKYAIGIRMPVIKRLVHQEILKREAQKELYKYKNQWEECARILYKNHSNSKLTLRSSFYSYAALLYKIERQALYKNDHSDHLVILEPGVFHKLNNILMYFQEDKIDKATNEIFSKIPIVPYALVYFQASPEFIRERFCQREGEKEGWKQDFLDFDEERSFQKILVEQKIIHAGMKILKKRGARVLEVNSQVNMVDKLNAVTSFLDGAGNTRKRHFLHI